MAMMKIGGVEYALPAAMKGVNVSGPWANKDKRWRFQRNRNEDAFVKRVKAGYADAEVSLEPAAAGAAPRLSHAPFCDARGRRRVGRSGVP